MFSAEIITVKPNASLILNVLLQIRPLTSTTEMLQLAATPW